MFHWFSVSWIHAQLLRALPIPPPSALPTFAVVVTPSSLTMTEMKLPARATGNIMMINPVTSESYD